MKLKLYVVLVIIGLGAFTSARSVKRDFHKGFNDLVKHGKETAKLKNSLAGIKLPNLFRDDFVQTQISADTCIICNLAMDIIITATKNNISTDLIANAVTYLCINLSIESENVCTGAIHVNKETFFYIIKHKNSKATSKRICSIILQNFKCVDNSSEIWTIDVPPSLPKNLSSEFQKNNVNTGSFKVLQLSDLHYDPNYEFASNADCLEPLCCQAGSKPANSKGAAGYWGDYRNCDLPWHTFVDTLDQIVTEHKNINYVYFTGDIINHKMWDANITSNKEAITKAFKQLKKSFGHLRIFSILGNHEPHPVNQFSYVFENNSEISTKWIFQLAAELWSPWLPKDTIKTIEKGGYYTVKVTDRLRIIALNSNVCYTNNFWLLYDDKDPFDQLQWLVEVLTEAEKNNEIVHLLSHIPIGGASCLHIWSKEFVRIIHRFSHIISAQFNGHTHHDDIVVFYSPNNETAINVAFNGGSLTTYTNLNPNYKVYYIDTSYYTVLDYESWTYNLTDANLNSKISPNWYKLYTFKEQYNLQHLTPASVSRLVEEMALQPSSQLLQTYFNNQYRKADTALAGGCNADCEIKILCYMVTYVHEYDYHCRKLTDAYNSVRPPTRSNTGIIN